MIVYVGLTFLLILQAVIISLTKKKGDKLFLVVAYFEILFIAGFRVSVGGDTEVYIDLYKQICQSSFSEVMSIGYEKGFLLYCYILSRIISVPQAIVFFSIAIVIYLVFYYIYRKSEIVWLSVVLYITLLFFFNFMNLMRFGLACSILLYALEYAQKRCLMKFLFVVLVAYTFHVSSLLFICIYFMYSFNLNKKNIVILLLFMYIVNFMFASIFDIVTMYFDRYASYQSSDGGFRQSSFAGYLFFIQYFTLFIFAWRNDKYLNVDIKGENKLYLATLLLGVLMSIMAIKIMMFTRFLMMFSIIVIIYIPNILSVFRYTIKYYLIVLMMLFLTILQLVIILKYRPDWYLVTPYHNCLLN